MFYISVKLPLDVMAGELTLTLALAGLPLLLWMTTKDSGQNLALTSLIRQP